MLRFAVAAALAVLSGCGQPATSTPESKDTALAKHALVGITLRDAKAPQKFELEFTTGEAAEVRIQTSVAACSWQDKTADAVARNDNTTFRIVERPYAAAEAQPTGEPASYRIVVDCPKSHTGGTVRFQLAVSQDLQSATRLEEISDPGVELFGSSAGGYDLGRTLTRS